MSPLAKSKPFFCSVVQYEAFIRQIIYEFIAWVASWSIYFIYSAKSKKYSIYVCDNLKTLSERERIYFSDAESTFLLQMAAAVAAENFYGSI